LFYLEQRQLLRIEINKKKGRENKEIKNQIRESIRQVAKTKTGINI